MDPVSQAMGPCLFTCRFFQVFGETTDKIKEGETLGFVATKKFSLRIKNVARVENADPHPGSLSGAGADLLMDLCTSGILTERCPGLFLRRSGHTRGGENR